MYALIKNVSLRALLAGTGMIMMLMIFPQACTQGIARGLEYTARILLPSLFPYMVIASFLMRSGGSELFGRLFSRPLRFLLRLPACCGGAILISFIGGFPIGAKCVQILYTSGRINDFQAQKMMSFCVCSGPAFLITAIGCVMLGNPVSGLILYISQIISAVLICIIYCLTEKLFVRNKKAVQSIMRSGNTEKISLVSNLTDSCSDASYSMLCMTGLVSLFCMLISFLDSSGFSAFFSSVFQFLGVSKRFSDIILAGIIEVTSGCSIVYENSCPLWCFAAVTGFGGLCVHFQIFALIRNIPINRGIYLFFRIVNAALSALVCYTICCIYVPYADVISIAGGHEFMPSDTTIPGSAAIILLCLLFVLSIKRGGAKIRI